MNRTILKSALVALVAGAALIAQAADAPSAGLIGCWNFNEADEAQVTDSSASGHHGKLRGAVRVACEKFGRVIDCQKDALVEVPHAASLDQMPAGLTVAAWVHRRTNNAWNTVISREVKDGPSEYFGLAVVKNKALFSIDPDGAHYQNIKSDVDLPVGEWIHLAGTYDNAEFKLYVNGRLVKSAPGSGPFHFQDQNPLLIGGNTNNKGQTWLDCFHGMIDEVRLFNRALSEPEIQALSKTVSETAVTKKLPPTGPKNSQITN